MDISDVSVVICTRNNRKNIEKVVLSIVNEKPGEIIVVDGNSTDGTKEILKKMPVKLMEDSGKGLSLARQIALDEVKGKWVCYIGDDNVLKRESIKKLKEYIVTHDWIGGAFQTRVYNHSKTYWSYCANWRWIVRFYEGERSVIGTPYMFETNLMRAASFDGNCTVSDDSDIEKRMALLTAKKWGYTNIKCFEIGKVSLRETVKRFLMYGKSDAQYWKKYSNTWGFRRKIQSLLHPVKDEFIDCIKKVKPISLRIYVFPYFAFITLIRYWGWIRSR